MNYTPRYYAREYADFRQLRREFLRHGFTHSFKAIGPVLRTIRAQWAYARKQVKP